MMVNISNDEIEKSIRSVDKYEIKEISKLLEKHIEKGVYMGNDEKVKVEIPIKMLDDIVNVFKVSIDEAIEIAVSSAVKLITNDLKKEYEEFVESKKK